MDGRDLGYSRAACTEFPNDNPALHRGAIWYCATVGAPASCELPVTAASSAVSASATDSEIASATDSEIASATDSEIASATGSETESGTESDTSDTDAGALEAIEIVDELTFEDDADEAPASAADETPSAANADPFLALVDMMETVAHAAGANEADRTLLRALLGLTRMASIALDPDAQNRLDAQLAVQGPNGLVRAEMLTRQVQAWQGILRGESEDYAACGSATLDEWAADLISRALGSVARAGSIRRDLRSRGVAAFGLIAAA
jgi:hypothetical protein